MVQCLNNRDPVPASCKHFAWRKDIPRGKDGRPKEICEGELCQGVGKKKASTWSAPSGFVRAAADTSRPFCRALSRADTRTTARESSILNPPVAVSHASSHRKTSTPTNGMLSSYR